jgi:Protein of unknown function (DUF4239)
MVACYISRGILVCVATILLLCQIVEPLIQPWNLRLLPQRSPRLITVQHATQPDQENSTPSAPVSSYISLNTLMVGESQFFGGDIHDDSEDEGQKQQSLSSNNWEEWALWWTPMVVPVLAFLLYDATAYSFSQVLQLMATNKNWVAVDGGAYQAQIITPAVNGVVVPSISILFANLIGTTISTLRQRQLDIRTALNIEAGQLRILQSLLQVFPAFQSRNACRQYATQYTSRLISESQPTVPTEFLDMALDTELNAIMNELNRIAILASAQQQNNNKNEIIPQLVLSNAFGACNRLYEERAKRITALTSLFPPLHFVIVATLAVSICVAFLLESNQVLLVFLNDIQLRILWTMLVGTFSALAIVCYDLGNPFRGSYQISKAVDQLYNIRLTLRASMYMDMQQQQQRQQEQTEKIIESDEKMVSPKDDSTKTITQSSN